MIGIHLFGTPKFTVDEHPLTISRRKSRLLLIYLAAHTIPVRRSHILPLLWPDLPAQAARKNLRVTLSGLRKQIGDLLITDQETLALAATGQVKVDARQLARSIKGADKDIDTLSAALDLYRGDFLADVDLAGLEALESWRIIEQVRYQRMVNSGFIQLSHLYEERQAFRAGVEALDRVLIADPLQEDLQRRALHLHYLAGDRSGAITRYTNFQQLLIDEMGVPPMDETQSLYDAIVTDQYQPALQVATHTPSRYPTITKTEPDESTLAPGLHPFVGRDALLETIGNESSHHQLILLQGEAGIGKSRLMDEAIRQRLLIEEPQPVALVGQARELEAIIPYQVMSEALRSLARLPAWEARYAQLNLPPLWEKKVARLLPDLLPYFATMHISESKQDEFRLWEGISQFLLALARQQPLILALDDLQWADTSSLGLLAYVIRKAHSESAPITFLATSRPFSTLQNDSGKVVTTLLDVLMREGMLRLLTLNRLNQDDVAALMGELDQVHDPSLIEWLMAQSEGNPFILTELLHYISGAASVKKNFTKSHFTFGRWTDRYEGGVQTELHSIMHQENLGQKIIIPPTVYPLIQSRLKQLSDTGWQVLSAAVVLGREFEFDVLAHAVALSELNTLEGLEELESLHLIHAQSNLVYRFDHHLTLAVAAQEIGDTRKRIFHRRAGNALEAHHQRNLDAVAGQLSYHFIQGGQPEKALTYSILAGQQAASVAAWTESIAFYDQALQLASASRDQVSEMEMLLKLSEIGIQGGTFFTRSLQATRMALDLFKKMPASKLEKISPPIEESTLYGRLALVLVQSGRFGELAQVVEGIPTTGYANRISVAFARGAIYAQTGTNLELAIAHFRQVAELLDEWNHHDPDAASRSLFSLRGATFEMAQIYAKQGDLPNAIKLYREGVEWTRPTKEDDAVELHVMFNNNLAYHLLLQGDPSASETAEAALTMARERGVLSALPFLLSTNGEIALSQHDLDSAEAYFTEGLMLAKQFDASERIAGLTANLGLVAKERGEFDTAIDFFQKALIMAEEIDHHYMATQIRLWMAPLLPQQEADEVLNMASQAAAEFGFEHLLDTIDIGAFNRGAKGTIGQRVFESLESDVREQGVEPKDREEL